MEWLPDVLGILGTAYGSWQAVRARQAKKRRAAEVAAIERRLELAGDIGTHFAEALRRGDLVEMKRLNEHAARAGLGPR